MCQASSKLWMVPGTFLVFTSFHDRINLLNSFLDVFLYNDLNQRGAETNKNEGIGTI